MTWEEKFEAIKALGEAHVDMRSPGDWYVDSQMYVGGDGMLTGVYGNGASPQEAIEAHWKMYSALPHDRYVVTGYGADRKHHRWNGYMWRALPIPTPPASSGGDRT
mgnify:CR=1 FL=1